MKRILLYLATVGATILFISRPAFGQEDAWIKKSPPSDFISSVETTPWGVLAGELDNRPGTGSYNGVYISKDLGETWEERGLDGRRVTDIAYDSNKIYITTKQYVDGTVGLFSSVDGGVTWSHQSDVQFSALSVDAFGNTIVLGGGSRGIWISFDSGTTWEQKVGDGTYGPDIYEIRLTSEVFMAVSDSKVYKSYDSGVTWDEEPHLNNKSIRYLEIHDNLVLAGSTGGGLHKSNDFGQTWTNVPGWGDAPVGAMIYFQKTFYAGRRSDDLTYSVFESTDSGEAWTDTNLNTNGTILDLATTYSSPNYLFAATLYDGIHRKSISPPPTSLFQFLDVPWVTQNSNDLVDKITAYFDHQYPLLGYNYHSEPTEHSTSTMDFYGSRQSVPEIYYSSHNGFDFALPYGTEITAPYSGYATYYYCKDCGHSIKINHQNGYESVYMHLQNDGLISTSNIPVWVEAGNTIGKVGLTGKTTGPHLHLGIIKDVNNSGTFVDDFPGGKVDPFGWQSNDFNDPWSKYSWTDVLGEHTGSESSYLWSSTLGMSESYIDSMGGKITLDNKTVVINQNASSFAFKIFVRHFIRPIVNDAQNNLTYIENTSMVINALNNVGEKVSELLDPARIEMDFGQSDLSNVVLNTLNIYYLNENMGTWEPAQRVVLDLIDENIAVETDHFSQFALFGEKIDGEPPTTQIAVTGNLDGEWFTDFPTVDLNATDNDSGVSKTLYKIADEIDWNEYVFPFTLEREGVFGVEFMSIDNAGNLESSKDLLVKINTNRKWRSGVKVKAGNFTIN